MNDRQWEEELLRLKRRIEKIAALQRGDMRLRRVSVGAVKVRAHVRQAHTRYVFVVGKKR